MKDMPFLNAFFNNPLMDSLFGETEISASIRQMKENVDPNFRLDEFVEEIESIVTPKFVKWYLEGNADKLKPHCGEAAFAAVNASINARRKQKLELDTNILAGPSDFELKAAKSGTLGEDAAGSASPLFVFTFNAQQINCLRDAEGNVVEGAVDDIRQLFYAIALQRNPKANSSSALEFPWQIQEIAILGNQPCW
jgi:import inner membrane translocase subunit TIM44